MPLAIWLVLPAMAATLPRTLSTMPVSPCPTPSMARISWPISSLRGLSRRAVRSPSASREAAPAACVSGWLTMRRSSHQNAADTASATSRPAARKRLRLATSSPRRESIGTVPAITHCHSG
ncbi:hypothetical protein D3C72_1449370 [compost metagenome]